MGEWYHKVNPSQSTTCHLCKRKTESETHLYRCPAQREAMEAFLQTTLQDFLEAQTTCPELANTLIDSLYCDLHDSRYPKFTTLHGAHIPKFRELHQAQAFVGWSQLFQGRLITNWSQLQEDYLETNQATLKLDRRYYSGELWMRKVISLLWAVIRAQWDHHNADLHGKTKAENYAIRKARLLGDITALYEEAPNMLAADRGLLAQPITDRMKRHPATLGLWLRRTKQIARISKQDAEAVTKRTHSRLTKYFRRKTKKKSASTDAEKIPDTFPPRKDLETPSPSPPP
jgi:hypothetical protein